MSNVIDETYLVNVNSAGNNNKFYEAKLLDSGTIETRWGRVGADGQRQTKTGGRYAYEDLIRKKEARGYSKVDVVKDTVATGPALNTQRLADTARASLISDADPVLVDLVDRLVAANKHSLLEASGGQITVDTSGQVRTPLGVISASAIREARGLLDQMSTLPSGVRRGTLTEKYLRLIPQKIPVQAGRGWAEGWLDTMTSTQKQYDLLDALTASVSYADTARRNAEKAAAAKGEPVQTDFFRYKVSLLDPNSEEYQAVVARYEDTVQRDVHSWGGMKVKRVFALTDTKRAAEVKAQADKRRNVRRLWHGTVVANVLSILQGGLIVPPSRGGGSIHVTGRMFGDGVYLSRSASKSLGYSVGYWSGGRQASAFMFLTHTAMGKEYRPTTAHHDSSIPQKARQGGYDSINVNPGRGGVRNHEAIVWDVDQVGLSYLVEFG